jgi:hypothetical protein
MGLNYSKVQLSLTEANAKSSQLSPSRVLTNLVIGSPKNKANSVVDDANLQLMTKAAMETNEIMKANFLKDVWTFEDLHRDHDAPAYIYRIRKCVVRHIQTVGDSFILVNSLNDNVDIFAFD